MVIGKVATHLCLTLIIKELKISVELDRVVTTLNFIFSVALCVDYIDHPNHCVLLFGVTCVLPKSSIFNDEISIMLFGHFRTSMTLFGETLYSQYIVIAPG